MRFVTKNVLDELETLKKNGNPTIHEFVEEHAYFAA